MECEHAQPGSLRQGDIFAAHPGTDNWINPFRRLGVIVSADCDLHNNKQSASLIYVPILGLHNFVSHSWLPTQAGKLQAIGNDQLNKLIDRISPSLLTTQTLHTLAHDDFLSTINKLQIATPDQAATKAAIDTHLALCTLSQLSTSPHPTTPTEITARLRTHFALDEQIRRPPKSQRLQPRAHLNNALQSLGDKDRLDTWPICELIGLDGDMREDEPFGFVATLRHFAAIPLNLVHVNRKHWQNSPSTFLRICRLRGIYKTDLMQRFANLFTRVGLEDERSEIHKKMFERVANKLAGEQSQ